MKSKPQYAILILFLILVTAPTVTAQAPRYEVALMEPLVTPEGDLVPVRVAWKINNVGQVVGTAGRYGPCKYAAFRYTPGVGTENLDPKGTWESFGKGINDRGQVFGYTIRHWCNPLGMNIKDNIFLYSDDGGFDFLEKGSSKYLVRNLIFRDMNDAGDIVVLVSPVDQLVGKSFLYTERDGWQNLADLHRRFRLRRNEMVHARLINNAGDITVTIARPGGYQDPFLLLGGQMLYSVGHLGAGINPGGVINDSGQMAGVAWDAAMREHAFYFTPSDGIVDIHPRRFFESYCLWINSEGVLTCMARKEGQTHDTLFTWDERRRPRVEILGRRADFRALFKEKLDFGRVALHDVNEALEMVGEVWGRNTDGKKVTVFFYFSPETGALDLSELFEPFEPGATLYSITDMNDRGDILAEMRTVDGYVLDVVLYRVDE